VIIIAIQKPYNLSLRGVTIDANESNKIKWEVSGAIQTAYSLQIKRNSDGVVILNVPKTNSYSLEYTIPPSTLINGIEYTITVTVYDETNTSATSDQEIFQTSSRPIVILTPVSTVASSSYNFQATYSQAQSVGIKSYIAFLYDSNQNLITQSNIKTILPMEHIFTDLQSEKDYYVEFQATSNKGLTGTTGLNKITILYTQPRVNVNLVGENIPNAGIKLSWNVVQILGHASGTTSFVGNEKIDVKLGKVYFDNGFTIDNDFTLKIWLENPTVSNSLSQTDLVVLKGANGTLTLQLWDDNKYKLLKDVNGYKSFWKSGIVSGTSHCVVIQQIDDLCNLYGY
jgi:hypothetical protein